MTGETLQPTSNFAHYQELARQRYTPEQFDEKKRRIQELLDACEVITPEDTNGTPLCIDGRKIKEKVKAFKAPGASLYSIVTSYIFDPQDRDFDAVYVTEKAAILKKKFKLGAHVGSHKHGEASDCGFADRLVDILNTLKNGRDAMLLRLADQSLFQPDKVNESVFNAVVRAYDKLQGLSVDRIKIFGKALIDLMEENGATITNVLHDHEEKIAVFNTEEGTTIDNEVMNNEGISAFDFDIHATYDQLRALGVVDDAFGLGIGLAIYDATAQVLVAQKDKSVTLVVR